MVSYKSRCRILFFGGEVELFCFRNSENTKMHEIFMKIEKAKNLQHYIYNRLEAESDRIKNFINNLTSFI